MFSTFRTPKVTPFDLSLSRATTALSSPRLVTPSTSIRPPLGGLIMAVKKLAFFKWANGNEEIDAEVEAWGMKELVKEQEEEVVVGMTLASALQMTPDGAVSEAEKVKIEWESRQGDREDVGMKSSINLRAALQICPPPLRDYRSFQSTVPASVNSHLGPGRKHFCEIWSSDDRLCAPFPPTSCQWGGHQGHTYLDLPDCADVISVSSSIKAGPRDPRPGLPIPALVPAPARVQMERDRVKEPYTWLDEVAEYGHGRTRPHPMLMERDVEMPRERYCGRGALEEYSRYPLKCTGWYHN